MQTDALFCMAILDLLPSIVCHLLLGGTAESAPIPKNGREYTPAYIENGEEWPRTRLEPWVAFIFEERMTCDWLVVLIGRYSNRSVINAIGVISDGSIAPVLARRQRVYRSFVPAMR